MSMARAPAEGRGAYIAAYGAVTGVGVVLSGLLGGVIAEVLNGVEFSWIGLTFNHYSILFAGSILLRLTAALTVLRRL